MLGEATKGQQEDSAELGRLVRTELSSIPIQHWGFFFPVHLAVWRFIESRRAGSLGPVSAGFDEEPYFRGKGSTWFAGVLGNNDEYLTSLEQIMYPVVNALGEEAKSRGHVIEGELPFLNEEAIQHLASLVLREVDAALAKGLLD